MSNIARCMHLSPVVFQLVKEPSHCVRINEPICVFCNNSVSEGLQGGYPLRRTLIFYQFVESDPKGLGLKYLAG